MQDSNRCLDKGTVHVMRMGKTMKSHQKVGHDYLGQSLLTAIIGGATGLLDWGKMMGNMFCQ